MAAAWDPRLTLSQNYRRLGLSAKLNSSSGGVETSADDVADLATTGMGMGRASTRREPLNITSATKKKLEPGSVRVVRDSEGRIVDVLREGNGAGGGVWGQPLNGDESGEEEEEEGEEEGEAGRRRRRAGIVPQLEEASRLEKRPRPRKQSQREVEWIATLVEKWGGDVAAMARDRKLNPMQQTEGDLRRRVRAWRTSRGTEMGDTMDVG